MAQETERELVKPTGRRTWENRKHEGVWYLAWTRGCGCGREAILIEEEDLRTRIWEAQVTTTVRPTPVPV